MKLFSQAGLFALILMAEAGIAQTQYVSDSLVITFRTGPSAQNTVTRNLTSGDRVELLQTLEDEGYSLVRLDDGAEGWVLTRYLQPEPTAELLLAASTRDLNTTRQENASLLERVEELESELASARRSLGDTETRSSDLASELADIREASASALETREENESLRRRVTQLTTNAEVAVLEIAELRRRERQNWFIVGAAVLLGGIVIGLIAPSLRPKRKSNW
jgi:SH3 domain protein